MTIIRHRQTAVNHTIPQNANKRALKGAKSFDRTREVLNPLPPYEFEFIAGGTLNYSQNFPVDPNIVTGFVASFDMALYSLTAINSVFSCDQVRLTTAPVAGGKRLALSVNGVSQTFTTALLGLARYYRVQLFFAPIAATTNGLASVYVDSVFVGSLTYPMPVHVSSPLVLAAPVLLGGSPEFAGVFRNLQYNSTDTYPIADNSNTLQDTGTNPAGNGTLNAGSNQGRWEFPSLSVIDWDYKYSAANTCNGIELTFNRTIPARVLVTSGVTITYQPAATPVAALTVIQSASNKILFSFTPQLLTGGQFFSYFYTRTNALASIPMVSSFYNVPRDPLLTQLGLEEP